MSNNKRGQPKITDSERLQMFMDSFHVLAQKPYWTELRDLGNVSKYGRIQLAQTQDSPVLYMQQSQMDPMHADLAGAYMRKYITGSDQISIDKVLTSAEAVLEQSALLAEAKSQWSQIASKPFKFLVENGEVVKHIIDLPAGLNRVEESARENLEPVTLTIRDFSQVFFYDGFLHAQDHLKDTGNRSLVRSIPGVLQTIMSHAAISASIYASLILHDLVSEQYPHYCPSGCQEKQIKSSYMESLPDNGE